MYPCTMLPSLSAEPHAIYRDSLRCAVNNGIDNADCCVRSRSRLAFSRLGVARGRGAPGMMAVPVVRGW